MFLKDRQVLNSKRRYTDEGFLVVPGTLARTGIQEYLAIELGLDDRDPGEKVNVYRPPEEVFSQISLSSFENKPVTNDHPPELVNADNFKNYSIGHVTDVKRNGNLMEGLLHIADKSAIEDIENGKVEISNGYLSDIVWEKGVTPEGLSYDAVQRNIRGNHIALVERGRCGGACKVSDNKPIQRNIPMSKLIIDGVDFEASEQVVQAVGKLQTRLSDAEKKAEMTEEELKKKKEEEEKMKKDHQAQLDKLQAKLDDTESKIPSAEHLDTLVDQRIATRDAAKIIVPDFEFQGKDCAAIKKEVVATKCPNVNLDSVSEDYIQARFDMLKETYADDPQRSLDESFTKQVENKDCSCDGIESDVVTDARTKFIERNRNAWKQNGGAE